MQHQKRDGGPVNTARSTSLGFWRQLLFENFQNSCFDSIERKFRLLLLPNSKLTAMQDSPLSWPHSKKEYYNPASKIRSLIENLDAELVQLCKQVPQGLTTNNALKPKRSNESHSLGSKAVSHISSATSPKRPAARKPNSGGEVQGRTLASIYRARVIDAYRNRRIFTVYGNYGTIRRALLRRGWLEKLAPGRHPKLQTLPEEVLLQHARPGNDYEAVAISRIINFIPSFFIWQPKAQRDQYVEVRPYRNRIRRAPTFDFATKVGLIGCSELEHWFQQEDVSAMSYPRFYRLGGNNEERSAFIEDYRHTQCLSLLRFLVENADEPDRVVDPEAGLVPPAIVDFALMRVSRLLGEWEHGQLDSEATPIADTEWKDFVMNSNQVLQRKAKIKAGSKELDDFVKTSRLYLHQLETKRPDYKWDGCRNLWILKPGYQSRGLGIIIRNSLDDMLQWASNNTNRRYIVQKYIERPLLIYRTKFDIRQHMLLVIGESRVSIWLYRDCYLRFSSQEYCVEDLSESIHLTNNSVQKKYKNKQSRDPRLPRNNMWSLDQFKVFLKSQRAEEDVWGSRIYVGFKRNLVAVVRASLEETEFSENSFELYGCDFMLDQDLNPILIEINSTPDLSPSTDVTARICPLVLKDLVKVVVDLPRNGHAPTGLFERVYDIDYKFKKDFDPEEGLSVRGKAMTIHKRLRTPFRPRFPRKAPKISKRADESKRGAPASPKSNGKPAIAAPSAPKTRSTSTSTSTSTSSKSSGSQNGDTKSLKATTKQALAIRYTMPK